VSYVIPKFSNPDGVKEFMTPCAAAVISSFATPNMAMKVYYICALYLTLACRYNVCQGRSLDILYLILLTPMNFLDL